MYEYRVLEKEGRVELAEKCSEMAKSGWRVVGYTARTAGMRDYYSAMLEKKAA